MVISSNISSHYQNSYNATKQLSAEEMQKVGELQSIDTKIKAHEMAHQATGGAFAGAPSYEMTKGPDGKDYAVGGEVPIKIEKGKTPDETISNMNQIKAAALAPADPSPQDLKVAQTADMIAAQAQQEKNQDSSNPQSTETQKGNNIDFYA
jgi:hypothetical protein